MARTPEQLRSSHSTTNYRRRSHRSPPFLCYAPIQPQLWALFKLQTTPYNAVNADPINTKHQFAKLSLSDICISQKGHSNSVIVIAQLLCLSHDAKLEKNRWWYATQLMSLASITRKHSLFKTCGKLCHIFDGEIFCPKVDLQKRFDFCHPQFCQIVVTPHLNILQMPPLWLTPACREIHLIPSESLWVFRGKFPWYHF